MGRSKQKITILCIDSDTNAEEIYNHLLDKTHYPDSILEFYVVYDKEISFSKIQEIKPDIVIIDIDANNLLDFDLCKNIREKSDNYVGIILIYKEYSKTHLLDRFEADDFCSKSISPLEMSARLHIVLRIKKMADKTQDYIQRLKQANKRLQRINITDHLTQIYNMHYFKKRLNQEFIRSKRYKKFVSLLMFDIDYFKNVNDTCDHLMGSFVLAELGKLVSKNIRKNVDLAARYGGDEFVVLLPECNEEAAFFVATKLSKVINEHLFNNGVHATKITVSVGIATMGEDTFEYFNSAIDLLRTADQYLFEAKRSGRNCVIDTKHRSNTE